MHGKGGAHFEHFYLEIFHITSATVISKQVFNCWSLLSITFLAAFCQRLWWKRTRTRCAKLDSSKN